MRKVILKKKKKKGKSVTLSYKESNMFYGTITTHPYLSFLFFGLVRSFMIVLLSYKYRCWQLLSAFLIYEARDKVYVQRPNVIGVAMLVVAVKEKIKHR